MYTPRSFKVDDTSRIHDLIHHYNFGTFVTHANGHTHVTHLPFMIDREAGTNGTLVAHMARANPHWKAFEAAGESLAVFVGPHAYISPGWYKDQVTVPTWNYAAVHVHGKPQVIDDNVQLRAMTMDLVDRHESPLGSPWDRNLAESVIDTELKGIVGFVMPIERVEGKWKFNQNRSREDRKSVARHLAASSHPVEQEVAAIIRRNLHDGD